MDMRRYVLVSNFPPICGEGGEKLDTRGKIGHENRSACEAWGWLNNFKMSAPRAAFGHFEIIANRVVVSYVILYVIISCDIVDIKMSGKRAAIGHFEIIAHCIICYYIM